jgi:hypothetical protein
MSWYISELALYHKDFIPVRPSIMARSCLALARCILGRQQSCYDDWSARYDAQVVLNLSNHLSHPSQALLRKYASPQLSSASTTIDLFLQHQAMLAKRVSQAPVNDMSAMEVDSQHPSTATYLTPQTPQKAVYASGTIGMLTPPITPDKVMGYGGPQNVLQHTVQCDPTPPSSGDHTGMNMHTFSSAPQHYMPQPQFVQ